MTLRRQAFLAFVNVVWCLPTGACHNDRIVAPDTVPPQLQIVSPTSNAYDTDGDSLVDIHLTWQEAGAIDSETVRLRSLTGVNGTADTTTNLLSVWRVEKFDSSSLIVHETIENLLHGGPNRIEIAVSDAAGNKTVDTLSLTLPQGVLFRTLQSGVTTAGHGIGAAVCPDDHRAYVTVGRSIVVIDADSLRVLAAVRNNTASDDLFTPLCIPGDPVLYVTQRVERFNRATLTWLPSVTGSFGSYGIAQSRLDQNLIYVGEAESGGIALIDRAQNTRLRDLGVPWSGTPENPEYVFDLDVLPGDAKLYFTRYLSGGILVANPSTGTIIKHIGIGGPAWPDSGRSDAFVMSPDGRSLFVAVLDGDPRGVVEINTTTDAVARSLARDIDVPQEIALSPSGRRLFVTTQDRFANLPSSNLLIDVSTWSVLTTFPRPRDQGAIRWDGGVAFHPNGKLVFVGRDRLIDVYLNRE